MGSNLGLSAPWYTYQKKLKALFSYDETVTVGDLEEAGEGVYRMPISVVGGEKAFALSKVIPPEVNFAGVILRPEVVLEGYADKLDLLKLAFEGNIAVRDVVTKPIPGGKANFVRFEPEVLQFFNDDLSDYAGNFTGLAHEVARSVFRLSELDATACSVDIRGNVML